MTKKLTIKRLQGIIERDTQRLTLWPNDARVSAWVARIEQAKAQLNKIKG